MNSKLFQNNQQCLLAMFQLEASRCAGFEVPVDGSIGQCYVGQVWPTIGMSIFLQVEGWNVFPKLMEEP